MGACVFWTVGHGETAKEAFRDACDEANAENGHQDGYSGDIQTCSGFTEITLKSQQTVDDIYESICDDDCANGKAITKWGNCACIKTGHNQYTFIGWGAE